MSTDPMILAKLGDFLQREKSLQTQAKTRQQSLDAAKYYGQPAPDAAPLPAWKQFQEAPDAQR